VTRYIIVAGVGVLALVIIAVLLRRGKSSEPTATLRHSSTRINSTTNVSRLNWLVGRAGDVDGKTYHVGTRTVTIGRGVSNFIQTSDTNASRVHCQIVPLPYGLEIKDMGSRNGTKVNGERISTATAVLKDGERLQIGEVVLEYQRQASFTHNDALEGKRSDSSAMKQTMMGGAMNVQALAQQAFEENEGDVKAAAESLGIDPATFLKMLEKKG